MRKRKKDRKESKAKIKGAGQTHIKSLTLHSSGTRPEAGEPLNFTLGTKVTEDPLITSRQYRKRISMIKETTLFCLIVLLAHQSAHAGCTSDNQCKGDRVCENERCINPDDYIDDNSSQPDNFAGEYSVPQRATVAISSR